MIKIKSILPSLREKKRYMVFEISKGNADMETSLKAIDHELRKFLGEIGYGKAGIMMVETKDNKAIMKVNHKHVDEARLALSLVKDINHEKVAIRTLGVSGILKKAKEKWL
ncbi:MAG TPA: Rpp14/Pop5 family protein [Candidatus Nanoarchaeia archaeon]|nr:Rpp14/Pop5 family protein [Candidatus Nanoarchaeia archaeon]